MHEILRKVLVENNEYSDEFENPNVSSNHQFEQPISQVLERYEMAVGTSKLQGLFPDMIKWSKVVNDLKKYKGESVVISTFRPKSGDKYIFIITDPLMTEVVNFHVAYANPNRFKGVV